MLSKILTCLTLAVVILTQNSQAAPTLIDHTGIFKSLQENGKVNILLSMTQGSTADALHVHNQRTFATRADRLNSVARVLKSRAAASQKNVLNFLHKEQRSKPLVGVKQLWISNQVMVKGADFELVTRLMARNDISKIEQERLIPIENLVDGKVVSKGQKPVADEEGWGVVTIEAPAVWESGNRGQNVTVANLDTGVRYTHEALRSNYRADGYGLMDIERGSDLPFDSYGHGTHTMGSIVGTMRGVGVAPAADWIACKMCDTSFMCSNWGILECGQWLACPTKFDWSDPDCSKAPHVISNSWGGFGQENHWYDDVISAWHAGGIIPIFSQGNSGPSCGSASSPGDYADVIGVGSTAEGDLLSDYSSVGPTAVDQRMKPDIAAPGEEVLSASSDSDDSYVHMSGTSMSSPHVTGLVALLLSQEPNLTYDEVKQLLQSGAVRVQPTGRDCGGVSEEVYPNNHVGYGRISALNSIENLGKMYQ